MGGSVTALIVWYNEPSELIDEGIASLLAQTCPPAEILIFENGPVARVDLLSAADRVRSIGDHVNRGYRAGITRAINVCTTEYLLVLNPDASADPACVETLVAAADPDPDVAIAGAQILLGDGMAVNAGDNPLHPTGISYSGRYGEPPEHAAPRDVAVTSGACWLIRRSAFLAIGGLIDEHFLYYTDVALAWSARISGMRVVFCPEATVRHRYEFSRHSSKWFLLERNRLFSVLCNYEARTLLALAPLLVLTELGLLIVAARAGWLRSKLRAYGSLVRKRSQLREHRRRVQSLRRCSDAQLMVLFSDRLDSPLIPAAAAAAANAFCVPYMWIARRLLGAPAGAR